MHEDQRSGEASEDGAPPEECLEDATPAVASLSDDDLERIRGSLGKGLAEFIESQNLDLKRYAADEAGFRQDPRFLPGSFGRRLVERYRSMPDQDLRRAVAFWVRAVEAAVPARTDYRTGCELAREPAALAEFLEVMPTYLADTPLLAWWAAALHQLTGIERLRRTFEEALADHEVGNSEDSGDATDGPMFTPLDMLLIRATIDSTTEAVGALAPGELAAAVDELVRLNSDRRQSWFHLGFAEVLLGTEIDAPTDAINPERRTWLRYGKLQAHLRREDFKSTCELLQSVPKLGEHLVGDPQLGRAVARGSIEALLEHGHDRHAAKLLEVAPVDSFDIDAVFPLAYQRARDLAVGADAATADRIFAALGRFAAAAVGWDSPDGVYECEDDVLADLCRRRSTALRERQRFSEASKVLEAGPEPKSSWVRGLVCAERGLIRSEISHLSHLHWPATADARAEQANRLQRGSEDFEAALAHDNAQHRSALALGLIAMTEQRWEDAIIQLDVAERGFTRDVSEVSRTLGHLTGALRGVAQLHGETGAAGASYKSISSALDAGVDLPASTVGDAVLALGMRDPDLAIRLMGDAVSTGTPISAFSDILPFLADERPEPLLESGLLEKAAKDSRIPPTVRLRLYLRGSSAAVHVDPGVTEALVDAAEDFVMGAGDPELDRIWADGLQADRVLRDFLGDQVHFAELEALKRSGRYEDAVAVATALFHRALSGAVKAEPEDLLELLEELDATEHDLASLRARMKSPTPDSGKELTRPVQLNRTGFVGGSRPLKAGWSHAERTGAGEADDASVLRGGEGPGGAAGAPASGRVGD